MSKTNRVMISYPYTGEPLSDGKINKQWMRDYLDNISTSLYSLCPGIDLVRHGLIPDFDDMLEQEIWGSGELSYQEKYNQGLQKCLDVIVEKHINILLFVLKAPGSSQVSDHNINSLVESSGMRAEREYADQHNLSKVVLLQKGMESVPWTIHYIKNAVVVPFDSIDTITQYLSDDLCQQL